MNKTYFRIALAIFWIAIGYSGIEKSGIYIAAGLNILMAGLMVGYNLNEALNTAVQNKKETFLDSTQKLTKDIESPIEGQTWINSTENTFKYFYGGTTHSFKLEDL